MEISDEEYLDLKNQICAMQRELGCRPEKISILGKVKERVIECIKNTEDDKPIFVYSGLHGGDSWAAMIKLAKLIRVPSERFRMDTTGYQKRPYIRSVNDATKPIRLKDLTNDQLSISVQMLDEIIPIFNKYFKLTHREVLYDSTGCGKFVPIRISEIIE